MDSNDIINSDNAVKSNPLYFFSDGNTTLQEKFNLGINNNGLTNIQSQAANWKEISSHKQNYQEQIQALVHQLKINEERHAKVLKEYQSILAEKNRLVEEKKRALERMHESHSKRVEQLMRTQQQILTSCQTQHKNEVAKLERQLQQLETEAKGVAVEQLLNNFEQEQHTLRVDCIPDFPVTIPSTSAFDSKNSIGTPIISRNTPYTSSRYIPTYAVSWPAPLPLSSLRKSSTSYLQEE